MHKCAYSLYTLLFQLHNHNMRILELGLRKVSFTKRGGYQKIVLTRTLLSMEYDLHVPHRDENAKKPPTLKNVKFPFSGILILFFGFIAGHSFFQFMLLEEPNSLSTNEDSLKVCFSSQGDCENLVIDTIASAEKSIKVQAYSLTSLPIITALIRAHRRGVTVQFICDKSQIKARHSKIRQLQQAKITVYIDKVSGLSHNKVMIIDDQSVITGSSNWSHAANVRNAENLLLIHFPTLAKKYNENWRFRLQGARVYMDYVSP